MLNKWLAGIVLGTCLNIISCSNVSSPDEFDNNAVIAVINNEEIPLDIFRNELKVHKKKFHVPGRGEYKQEELLWLKQRTLEQVVRNTLFRQEAKKHDIEISQEELNKAVLKTKVGYAEDSFNQQLEFAGLSLKEW
jgi:hypothetical protein